MNEKLFKSIEPYVFGNSNTSLLLICLFSLLYSVVGVNYIVTFIMIVMFTLILLHYGSREAIYVFVFISVWEEYTSLPVSSGGAIITCLLGCYIVVKNILKKRIKFKLSRILVVAICSLEAVVSLVKTRDMGVVLVVMMMFIVYEMVDISDESNELERYVFWRNVFKFLCVSSLLSVGWGVFTFIFGEVPTVYLNGLYIPRMKSIIGTDRACMLYCGAMIFPFFYINERWKKIMLCCVFGVSILLTLSITAIACLCIFVGLIVLHQIKHQGWNKKIGIVLLLSIVLIWAVYVWFFGSHISVVDTLVQRGHKIVGLMDTGELSKATSGRSEIWAEYLSVFNERPLYSRLFGTGVLNYYNTGRFDHYSHNSYIDMVLYMGIIPSCLVAIISLVSTCRLFRKKEYYEYFPILLIKAVYTFTGIAVSAFPAIYWWIWFVV